MTKLVICDSCRKPTKRVVLRLTKIPAEAGGKHSSYTDLCHIGECCANFVNNRFLWNKRRAKPSAKESTANAA